METANQFIERVETLEHFKKIIVTRFKVQFSSTKKLFELAGTFIAKDPNVPDKTLIWDTEPRVFGPLNNQYLTKSEAEQINMATAIKTCDLAYLEATFDPNTATTTEVDYNYCLFKHVFAWILPHFPTQSTDFNQKLAKLLSSVHRINDVFYHWSWYVFPRVLEHFTMVDDCLQFLLEASIKINDEPHRWEGDVDNPATSSLGRRPRPIFQLFWRWTVFHDYQEAAFVTLFNIMKSKGAGFMSKLWAAWKLEFIEANGCVLWEEPGRDYLYEPYPIEYEQIRYNLPLNVFMNGNQVRFTPYIARAALKVFSEIPDFLYDMIELQCNYVERRSRTVYIVEELFKQRVENDDNFRMPYLKTIEDTQSWQTWWLYGSTKKRSTCINTTTSFWKIYSIDASSRTSKVY